MNKAEKSGGIKKGSEAWNEMAQEINNVTIAIEEANTAILEYNKSIRETNWEVFDRTMEKISQITEEADFLIDLLGRKDLYTDNGQLTDEGWAAMGLHQTNYETYMAKAEQYKRELADIDSQLAKDPYDQELVERRKELLDLQRESITAAEDEKQAIVDMVKEGIDLELSALKELIDNYTDALDAQKDLYDYQKKVKDQTKDIVSLQKQLSAYAGDTSEEAKAKIQQIKVSLEEAQENLKDTEYNQYVSDQKKLLDDLYDEYEEVLNKRLDDVDALLSDMKGEIIEKSNMIDSTIRETAGNVGVEISGSLNTVLTEGVNAAVKQAFAESTQMQKDLEGKAVQNINNAGKSIVTGSNPPSGSTSTQGDGKVQKGDQVTFNKGYLHKSYTKGEGNYPQRSENYKGKKVYVVTATAPSGADFPILLGTKPNKKDKDYKELGWVSKKQISGYASGAKKIKEDEMAWTQEGRKTEAIIRPSDGAILTPLAQNDSVLNADATSNLFDFANDPKKFIGDNLLSDTLKTMSEQELNINPLTSYSFDLTPHLSGLTDISDLLSIIRSQGEENISTSIGDIHINIPIEHVDDYNDFVTQLQKDKQFEKLIHSMSIDLLSGNSKLEKNKYRWQ